MGLTFGQGGPLIRDCFWGSSIHVSRKGWHMLLNLCFHMAMTSAVFAGGITLTNYQMVCQAVSRSRGLGVGWEVPGLVVTVHPGREQGGVGGEKGDSH